MALRALVVALLSLVFTEAWAATMHHTPAWEPVDRALKGSRQVDSRLHDFYSRNGYEACEHHLQLGWLHLHRGVSSAPSPTDQ